MAWTVLSVQMLSLLFITALLGTRSLHKGKDSEQSWSCSWPWDPTLPAGALDLAGVRCFDARLYPKTPVSLESATCRSSGASPSQGNHVQPEEGVLPPVPQNDPHQFPPLADGMCFRAEGIRRVQLRHWCSCRLIRCLLQTLRASLRSSLPPGGHLQHGPTSSLRPSGAGGQ